MADILDHVLTHPPIDTKYVLGRWHRGRVSLHGIWVETKVALRAIGKSAPPGQARLLIIGRARSGSTLLTSLLNDHPEMQCDREIMAKRLLSPIRHFNNLARKSGAAAYGAKLLSYQMVQVQRFQDPVHLLQSLHDQGVVLVHLKRDTFAQTLSLYAAQSTQRYHASKPGDKRGKSKIHLEPTGFCKRLVWSDMLLRYEERCLRDIPHVLVDYDRDLTEETTQRATAGRIFEALGLEPLPVSSGLRKMLPGKPQDTIENYAEVAEAVRQAGLGHLLPE